MALTYLDSKMIEVPAAITDLSAVNLQVTNLTASNFETPTFGNAAQWNDVYTTVTNNSASWEETADILPTVTNYLSTELVSVSSLNVTEQLLSAGTDLFSIFLTQETDSQALPTVTNYLSTELVTISSVVVSDSLTATNLTVLSSQLTPTLSTDSGIKGTFKWDTDYLYICVETDTWKRVALSGWEG